MDDVSMQRVEAHFLFDEVNDLSQGSDNRKKRMLLHPWPCYLEPKNNSSWRAVRWPTISHGLECTGLDECVQNSSIKF